MRPPAGGLGVEPKERAGSLTRVSVIRNAARHICISSLPTYTLSTIQLAKALAGQARCRKARECQECGTIGGVGQTELERKNTY